jgi:hypothetical protein
LQEKVLYSQGANAITSQSFFIMFVLLAATVGSLIFMQIQRRRGKLGVELKWVLICASGVTGATFLLFTLSALPDLVTPPKVDRGRINKIYQRQRAAAEAPITRVTLSNGADLQVPAALVPELKAGNCIEVTRGAASGYIMIAKELPIDACLVR